MTERSQTQTERIYDTHPLQTEFEANVLSCEKSVKEGLWQIILDRTAFFPTGGGQPNDTGYMENARVSNVTSSAEGIIHTVNAAFSVGERVSCRVDREQRLSRMTSHSGEHIVSALLHCHYGLNNVGFHMGSEDITADFDGVISEEELILLEDAANEAVREDLPITVCYPTPEELAGMSYRSKLELTEEVRIVCIGKLDKCACCAPHVPSTGQIGLIRIVSCQHYKGGMRLHILCGADALRRIREESATLSRLVSLLSAKPDKLNDAVTRILRENRMLKDRFSDLNDALNAAICCSLSQDSTAVCLFDSRDDAAALRKLALCAAETIDGTVGVFGGSDVDGYKFVLCCPNGGLNDIFPSFAKATGCRGGGSDTLICGSAAALRRDITAAWETALREFH